MEIQVSQEDQSVNFIEKRPEGAFEARFVQRSPDYYIVYLSSFSGCNRSCRMCHLTAMRETSYEQARLSNFLDQAINVFDHIDATPSTKTATHMHFNFTARGEPLDNEIISHHCDKLIFMLEQLARARKVIPHFLFSTILPKDLNVSLIDIAENCIVSILNLDGNG